MIASPAALRLLWLVPTLVLPVCLAQDQLPDSQPLTSQGDLSAQMVAGIHRFLLREIDHSPASRPAFWRRDFSSASAYQNSVAPNRERFRKLIGAVDSRLPVSALELLGSTGCPAQVAETELFVV